MSPNLIITGLRGLPAAIEKHCPDYIISVMNVRSSQAVDTWDILSASGIRHQRVSLDERPVVSGAVAVPGQSTLVVMCEELDTNCPVMPHRLLVHCTLGVCRSPAIAMIALAHLHHRAGRMDDNAGRAIAGTVFDAAPMASPSQALLSLSVKLFDHGATAMIEESARLFELAKRRDMVHYDECLEGTS